MPESGGRDQRLDFLRGLCLFKMVCNHLWRTPLHVVHQWTGFVSAAEGFFLISGVVVGMVHTRRIDGSGWDVSARQSWRRAGELYLANVGLVLLLASFEAARLLPQRPILDRFWGEGWTALLSFEHPYYLQVLPRYSVFLAVTPLVFLVLRRWGPGVVLALSGGVWAANWLSGGRLAVPMLEAGGAEGFPSSSWQVVFFAGLVLGATRSRWRGWVARPIVVAGALAVWILLIWWHLELLHGRTVWSVGPGVWTDRSLLAPLRLLNLFVAAIVCWAVVDRCWRPLDRALGPLLMPFGRFALRAFLLHVVVAWVGLAVLLQLPLVLEGWELVPMVVVAVWSLWWTLRREWFAQVVPR